MCSNLLVISIAECPQFRIDLMATGPSLRKRFGYWCVSKLLRLLEVSVKCLEVQFEDTLSPTCTLIWIVQVTGHLDFIAKPLPKK